MLTNPTGRLATAKVLYDYIAGEEKPHQEFPSGSSREESKWHSLGMTVQLQALTFQY